MDFPIAIPLTFWSHSQPTFRISSICVSPNKEKLVTGSFTGQLCIWNLNLNASEIVPINIVLGHQRCVTCLASTDDYVVSCCEGGQIFRWNLDDGYCTKKSKSNYIHRKIELFTRTDTAEECFLTCGDYSELFILHSFTLQILFILCSREEFSWISSFHIVPSQSDDTIIGITINGYVRVWNIKNLANETHFEALKCDSLNLINVVDLKCHKILNQFVIVSEKSWMLYDSELLNCICTIHALEKERLLGGNICDINVITWTDLGRFYIYDVIDNMPKLICSVIDDYKFSLFDPTMSLLNTESHINYLIRGDSEGRINFWGFHLKEKKLCAVLSTSIKEKWKTSESCFLKKFVKQSNVTCCIYILEFDLFVIGCSNGNIICISALQSIMSFYFDSSVQEPPSNILFGHNGRINYLLYPHEIYQYFNKSYLVSGGSDFSVCLWDIVTKELLHKFCMQSGEILKLILPPSECSPSVKHSICSISSDHSVAVLNLKDKRCIILTSRHEFPVVEVYWKPLDDFIIVECFDGTVYVWQMETGHLDRILIGVTAQEVLYACSEHVSVPTLNFYVNEKIIKNSMKRELFQIQDFNDISKYPFKLCGFLTSAAAESQIFICNLEYIMTQISVDFDLKQEVTDCGSNNKIFLLTQALDANISKNSEITKQEVKNFQEYFHCQKSFSESNGFESELFNTNFSLNNPALQMMQCFLSLVHFWGLDPNLDKIFQSKLGLLKPAIALSPVIISNSMCSLFFPSIKNTFEKSSSVVTSISMAVIVLTKVLNFFFSNRDFHYLDAVKIENQSMPLSAHWTEVLEFYEKICSNPNNQFEVPRPKVDILAKAWQTKCPAFQGIVKKLLCNYLQSLNSKENVKLLDFWYRFLPHFKIIDLTSLEKVDFENLDLKTIALVLFGAVGSNLKFKANDFKCQENYIYQTCASFVYLLLASDYHKNRFSDLVAIAVDFLGRGYIVWEQFLGMEKIVPILLEMCSDVFEVKSTNLAMLNKSQVAHNALKSIAIARTAAFINYVINEINHSKSGQQQTAKSSHFVMQQSKAIILSILTFLLEKTPYIMVLYLNDAISIFVYCIEFCHFKQENLNNLLPVMQKFRQVHHSISSQIIAVGLATGAVVLHDLKTGKTHEVSAHKDSVDALKFSEDGKSLASYSCYENRISFWQVLTGIFGLRHVQVRYSKSYETYKIHDEEIRNHLEIASLTWTDKKSVLLSLCDGSKTIFQY